MLRPWHDCSAWRPRWARAPGPCLRQKPRYHSRAGRPGHSGSVQTARGCLKTKDPSLGLAQPHTSFITCHLPRQWGLQGLQQAGLGLLALPPVGLLRLLPCCLRLASLRMSMIKVANSRALNRANFCRPYKAESWHEGTTSGWLGGWNRTAKQDPASSPTYS